MSSLYEIKNHIREKWFPEHKATYAEHGDLKVLTWKKEGTVAYYIRYVFDGSRMYVSGDLGEAVFCFSELVDVDTVSRYSLDYFEEKMRAYHGNRREFDVDKAMGRLREWLKELKKKQIEYDHDEMREFFEEARSCSSSHEWAEVINKYDFIEDIEPNYWEWMYSAGDEIPFRVQGYLVGLKMAAEQLKEQLKG